MTRPLSPHVLLSLGCAAFLAAQSPLPAQVTPAAKDTKTPAAPEVTTSAPSSPDLALLGALQSNPVTAPYRIGTALRGGRVVLWGKVGTKYVHDVAVRIAIDLGYPFRDDLVIDTSEAHRVAAHPAVPAVPFAGALVGPPPYLYPSPLFGRLDDPFYGMEPPLISYPPWWPAVVERRPAAPADALRPDDFDASLPTVNDQILQRGTVELTIDPRGRAILRGSVPTLADRIAIGQKLAQTPGVPEVVNLLDVDVPDNSEPPPPPVPVPSPDRSGKPPAAPRSAPRDTLGPDGLAAAVTINPGRPREDLSDRLSRTFAERPALADQPIKITAREGVVTLAGRVPTAYEAMLAFRAAQQTPGVREVIDRLEFVVPDGEGKNPLLLKGRPKDVEPYLTAQIRRQVDDLAHVDGIRLLGDTLTIQGTLRSGEDKARLDAILRSMAVLRGFRVVPQFVAQ